MSAAITRFMGPFRIRMIAVVAFALLLVGAVANVAMTPHVRMADSRNYDLETLIPASFGDWTEAKPRNLVLPDPSEQRLLNKLYNVVVTRTYRNQQGRYVMLVIAYGGDQSDALQLHRPEVCYRASGYDVQPSRYDDVDLAGHRITVARVPTRDGRGYEPVSYWMRVGARQVTTNMDRQIAKFMDGLHGVIPDGVLVRVSTRTDASGVAADYALQDDFVADLLSHVDAPTRELLVGEPIRSRGRSG